MTPLRTPRALLAPWILVPVALAFAGRASAAQQPDPQGAPGQVVVTVTTLDAAVHLPGVQIDLAAPSDSTVIASTTTDGTGMVTFPEVPPGRYMVTATRAGFI